MINSIYLSALDDIIGFFCIGGLAISRERVAFRRSLSLTRRLDCMYRRTVT